MNKRREISLLGTIAVCAVVILLRHLLKVSEEEQALQNSGKIDIPGL
jgi:hypothetical protein